MPLPNPLPGSASAAAIVRRFAFPSDLAALGPALRSVADTCRDLNVPVLTILQIELLLEELFTNSVAHGYAAANNEADSEANNRTEPGASAAASMESPPAPAGPAGDSGIAQAAGPGNDAPERIWISLQQQGGSLHITYADAAPPYNPLNASHNQFDTAPLTLEKCPIGGVGLILIQQAPFPLHYAYRNGQNRIRFTVELPGDPASDCVFGT